MQRVNARRVSFDGFILAPDESLFGVAGHYRFILQTKGGTINLHRVGAPESGPGRELAFEGQTSYGTYRLVLSLRRLPAKGVQVRAHIDGTVCPSHLKGESTGSPEGR
jgi:hypothetical protein